MTDNEANALAQPEPEGPTPTPDDFRKWWRETGSASPAPNPEMLLTANAWAEHWAARCSRAQPEPVGLTDGTRTWLPAAPLAQPEPKAPALTPTFMEIVDLADQVEADGLGQVDLVRHALARWGRPAIQPISAAELLEPEWKRQKDQTGKTTDGAQLIDGKWWAPYGSDMYSMQRILDNARDHAARWGRPTIQPVPAAERPWEREGWCDAEGRCWWGRPSEELCNSDWHLATRAEVEKFCSYCMPIVSLPHHALPIP